MVCEKCNMGRGGFCPVTLGLALGLTCALSVLFLSIWAMCCGLPAGMEAQLMHPVATTWPEAGSRAVWALVKGFAGGFIFALIYDLICCCKAKCCGKCSCCKK